MSQLDIFADQLSEMWHWFDDVRKTMVAEHKDVPQLSSRENYVEYRNVNKVCKDLARLQSVIKEMWT